MAYRRITHQLGREGIVVNHKRVLRLMREDNLLCLRRKSFLVTTDSDHALLVYPAICARSTWRTSAMASSQSLVCFSDSLSQRPREMPFRPPGTDRSRYIHSKPKVSRMASTEG
jgi:transposase InsO family protein